MNDFSIDLGSVSATDCIPSGDYAIQCVGIELKATKDGYGQYLSTQFEVLAGERKGKRIFTNFNIKNRNQQAVDIALRSVKQWVQACGGTGNEQLTMGLLQSMQGKEVFANIAIQQGKDGYEDSNTIKRFHVGPTAPAAKGFSIPTSAAPAMPRAPSKPAATVAKNPWEA